MHLFTTDEFTVIDKIIKWKQRQEYFLMKNYLRKKMEKLN